MPPAMVVTSSQPSRPSRSGRTRAAAGSQPSAAPGCVPATRTDACRRRLVVPEPTSGGVCSRSGLAKACQDRLGTRPGRHRIFPWSWALPVHVSVEHDHAVYVEPNVWVHHHLRCRRRVRRQRPARAGLERLAGSDQSGSGTWCGADARVSGRPTACSRNQNATARARSDVMANPNQPTLNPGVTGPAVRRLQRALRRGESRGLVVDGAFGPKTEAAVRSLQAGHDLVVDGIVGPATWAALPDGGAMPLLRRGSAGDVVMALQRMLAAAASEGWPSPGAADGDFGPQTEAAVRGFQAWGGVVVDGVVGDQTWSVSLNALGATLETSVGLQYVVD